MIAWRDCWLSEPQNLFERSSFWHGGQGFNTSANGIKTIHLFKNETPKYNRRVEGFFWKPSTRPSDLWQVFVLGELLTAVFSLPFCSLKQASFRPNHRENSND